MAPAWSWTPGWTPNEDGFAALPPFELLKSRPVDHIVVTHAHHDHLGALPVLAREIPHAPIHVSRPTAMLAEQLFAVVGAAAEAARPRRLD